MKRFILKSGKWFGYVIFTIVATMGFLYLRFPAEAVKTVLISEAAGADPPMLLSLKGVRASFPPGVALTDVGVALKKTPQEDLLRAERISVTPAVWSWVTGTPRYRFDAHAYNGAIEGQVHLGRHAVDAPLDAAVRLRDIQIGLHASLQSLVGRDVSGVMAGELFFEGHRSRLMGGTGEATIVISDGKVALPQPILGLSSIDFDRLSAKVSLKDQRVMVSHVRLEGRAVKGELSGTIILNADVERSRLDLKGTLEPLGGLLGNTAGRASGLSLLSQGLKKLRRSFVIQGTFLDPVFRFS
jgi:type II secretion system protein N